jgi:hypothetical protein
MLILPIFKGIFSTTLALGNKVVIDHGQFNISINQELIPARYTSNDENEDIQIYRIKVTRTVVIPPWFSFNVIFLSVGFFISIWASCLAGSNALVSTFLLSLVTVE